MTRGIVALVGLAVCLSACLPRDRLNTNCEWTMDPARALDLSGDRDRQHLYLDADLAEDLSIRYADAEHRRRFGYGGHGGLIDSGAVRRGCMDTLFADVARTHAVSIEDVRQAVGHRSWTFDISVIASFAAIYLWSATYVVGWIRRSFGDSRSFAIVVTILTAVAAGAGGLALFAVWGAIAEMIRIGNDHMGLTRGLRNPWVHHQAELFVAGVLLFWLVATVHGSRHEASGA
jgi:hypothetical protein